MLSIIVSSYKATDYDRLTKSISDTIGTGFPYEIIQIWNPNLMGITHAYNLGAKKAKFDNFLFLHEDVQFNTKDWGNKIINHFKIDNLGIIGIAGGTYVPSAPCGWYTSLENSFINIIQSDKKNHTEKRVYSFDKIVEKVIAIDGVFLAMKRNVFNLNKFDENIRGFHGYDTELSLRVAKNYTNYIISDILIEHFSQGNPDKDWFDTNIYIRRKNGSDFNKEKNLNIELLMYKRFKNTYFSYYKKSLKNHLKVLKFAPIFKVNKRQF